MSPRDTPPVHGHSRPARAGASLALAAVALAGLGTAAAAVQRTYTVTGMVLHVEPSRTRALISHDEVPGLMPVMSMTFDVRDPAELQGVGPGTMVAFSLPISKGSAYAERLRIVHPGGGGPAERTGAEPAGGAGGPAAPAVAIGDRAPDVTLVDQAGQQIGMAQLRGSVVVLSFMDAGCVPPTPCFRVASIMRDVQRRFERPGGRDVVLLSITLESGRDAAARVDRYAREWTGGRRGWHFLTGPAADLHRVWARYGVDPLGGERQSNLAWRTAIIDRDGVVAAVVDGHGHTARQLGDLLDVVLAGP